MGVLTGWRSGMVFFLLTALVTGGLWLRQQMAGQEELRRLNQHLTEQNSLITQRMTQLSGQVAMLSAVLSEQSQHQRRLEENSDAVRKQLRSILAKDTCASEPVPDDVIRLQRNAFGSHSALSR